jgi:hypothetical protein
MDFNDIIQSVVALHDKKCEIDLVDKKAFPNFPFDKVYPGQFEALKQIGKLSCLISSHTGSGKSSVFIGATRDEKTIIVEPRKFLQTQIQKYFLNTTTPSAILFGRREYLCPYAPDTQYGPGNAGNAPCLKKSKCTNTFHKNECENYQQKCEQTPCNVFLTDEGFKVYPCPDCAYFAAQRAAVDCLKDNGTVIVNFGNFWNLLDHADNVVIDEADLFFKEISTPTIMTASDKITDIKQMLDIENMDIIAKMASASPTEYYRLKNKQYNVAFLKSNAELCFAYRKKNWKTKEEKIYVEINPDAVNVLKDKIFQNKRLIIVTATPTEFNLPNITYSVPQRCGIFYTPQGKLTSRELQNQPWILDNAATHFIKPLSDIFTAIYGSDKFVVHCGNIGNHAKRLYYVLGAENCILHEEGRLMQTIDKFVGSNKRFLLVASAEYGGDFTWCDCQFVLKVPYASLDDRMKALEKTMGKQKFKRFYTVDAITRLVQQCGRTGRGFNSFGCTFILDSKFTEIYKLYNGAFPDWFKARMIYGV